MAYIVFRKFTGAYAWSMTARDDALAICRSEREAAELVRILNNNDGPGRILTLVCHAERKAA